MASSFRPTRTLLPLVILTVLTSACESAKSPASPSESSTPASTASTASIGGSLQSGPAGLSVSVVGTPIAATLGARGDFSLAGVPTGNLQLRFSGSGADATLAVAEVQPAQTITLVVALEGTSARVETEMRSGAGEAELEARIEALPPATAAGSFKAGGRIVKTSASTAIEQQGAARTFADLTLGLRVHVRGSSSGSDLVATRIQMQSANSGPSNPNPPVPAPGPDAKEVETTGTIAGLSGSASAFQFTLGGTLFKGDAATAITGSSHATPAFAALKNGLRVEVKGVQDTGFVKLSRVHLEDDDDDEPAPPATPVVPASLAGTLTAKSGTAPNLTLTVAATTVTTDSRTVFKNRGNVVPLDGLAVGQTLEIEGSKQSDGSILAKEISLENDEATEAQAEGTLGALGGTCPAVTFTLGGTKVTTTSATEFKDVGCSALKNGMSIRADGSRLADGSILARRVRPR